MTVTIVSGRAGLQGGTAPSSLAFFEKRGEMAAPMSSKVMRETTTMAVDAMAGAPAQNAMPVALALADAAPAESEAAVQVRSDFVLPIVWEPDIHTDQNGRAEVSFTYPGSLTSWKAVARAVTSANQFGIDEDTTRTKQPLIVRLQGPRFFLVGDTVTVSADIINNTSEDLTVSPEIQASGVDLENKSVAAVKIAAGSEVRVDWTIRPRKPGEIKLKVSARAGHLADAMEKAFPVYEHGIEKFLAGSGKSRAGNAVSTLELPAERKPGSTKFTVQATPSLAVTMLDALPYLIDYPYGCTEQTMSRFLPAAITAKTLRDLGPHAEDVMGRVFGGIEEANVAKTHPEGRKNLKELSAITKQGLERLYNFNTAMAGGAGGKRARAITS